ncbi:hypothetical protein [Comamonas antarctica]|uniref:Lipoprotein n=1 Tax=Comamonas antarctica TaxID=2743470 RepID=A0A6N1X8N4_9BURK|nr:hypothetical protein [Comamonas antarctica]QKV54442.1 hypothetical protein HUK68_16840 [Comamonas antarctica]
MKQLWKWGWPGVLVVAMISACSGDGKGSDRVAGGAPAPANFKEAFTKLENAGKLPILDRSDSLAGPDINANGVRDDIDRYIDSKPGTQAQKNSLKALSRVLNQAMTVDTKDPNALRSVANSLNTSVGCMWKAYPAGAASPLGDEIEKLTVNTRARYDAYMRFNSAMNGSVISEDKELHCD